MGRSDRQEEKLRSGKPQGMSRNMQVDPHTEWTWKPAPQSWDGQAKVIVGALLIMAAGCVAAGFVIGRITARPAASY
jgi:hypothetical protein